MVADCIAKKSLEHDLGICTMSSVPAFAIQAVLDDIYGLVRPRVCSVA